MSNLESPKISEETKIILNNLWEKYPNLVVLGPAGAYPYDIRFRIYAYGGCIAGIPFNKKNDWLLLPHKNYKNYNKSGLKKYFDKKSKYIHDKSGLNNYIIELLQENTDNIIDEVIKAAEEKFSTEEKNPKERAIQTELIRKYLSEDGKSDCIICDMEFCVPASETQTGKRSIFDIIIMDPKKGKVGLIELKCNYDACKDPNGLQAHLEDMITCMKLPYVRNHILHRYDCLQKAGLISQHLPTADEIEPIFSTFGGFLFIDDGIGTLRTKTDVLKACTDCFSKGSIEYIKDKKNSILFLYADDVKTVDFNQMQSWNDFVKN